MSINTVREKIAYGEGVASFVDFQMVTADTSEKMRFAVQSYLDWKERNNQAEKR